MREGTAARNMEEPPQSGNERTARKERTSDVRELVTSPERPQDEALRELARMVVYNDDELGETELAKRIASAHRLPGLTEEDGRRLEALEGLRRGLGAHERANALFQEDWQKTLGRPSGRNGREQTPELPSRADVAEWLRGASFARELLEQEARAKEAYERALAASGDTVAALIVYEDGGRVDVRREDLEAALNDLGVRAAERIADLPERRRRLEARDAELADIIGRLGGDEDAGRRNELQEIYLLRRLIHAADTGHVASVEHGTVRQDLDPTRGSVDFTLTAAGRTLPFQAKTFNRNARMESRARQMHSLRNAAKHKHARAPVVVLDKRDVEAAYEKALQQPRAAATTRMDKFNALRPVLDAADADAKRRLLAVLGLTEDGMREERAAFERKATERQALEKELAEKRMEEERADEALEREWQEKHEAEERETREKAETIARRMREDAENAERERQAVAKGKARTAVERQARRQADRGALERIAADRAAAEEAARRKTAEREARREARKRREEQAGTAWPPATLKGLAIAPALQRLGMLPDTWAGDAGALLAAKKRFFEQFAKPKKGSSPQETDRPNADFLRAFPTREQFEDATGMETRREAA